MPIRPTWTANRNIVDNDSATISINAPSILEGGILAYSVTINNPVDVAITADRATADGLVNPATVADSDYTAIANSNVTLFAAGSTTAFAIPVQTTADNKVELDEQLRLILANLAAGGRNVTFSGGGASLTGTGTITNDDSATITINAPSIVEGGILAYSVTISNPVDVAVTADRATADGLVNPATVADSDYTAIANSNVTLFAAGSTTAFAIPVQTTADNKVELDEQLRLILSNLAAGGRNVTFSGGGASLTGTGTITNDDSATITINAPSIVEGGILAYSVTISNPVDVAVTADRATADGLVNPATVADSDYTAIANSNVTLFAAGSTTAFAIPVQTTADNKVELDEQLRLILSNLAAGGRNVSFSGGSPLTGTGTITNDDTAHITISDVSLAEGSPVGTTAFNFTVSIDNPVAFNVTVTANTADVTATLADSDYAQVLNQLVTFTAGGALMQTVTVNVNQDTTVEPTETFQVNLTNAQFNGATDATRATITDSQGIGTIINDDTAVSVAVSPSSVLEDGATNLVYTFTRTGATTSALTINFSVGGTATFGGGGADYTQSGADSFTATTGTVTFGIGNSTATVTLDPTADTTVELNETTVLTVTAGAGYGAGAPSTATGTITNDDIATITINAPSIVEGGILAYSVTISNPVDVAVTADRATADGLVNPATVADSDYTAIANSNVTLFAAGSTTAFAIPVQTTADNKVELDEQLADPLEPGGWGPQRDLLRRRRFADRYRHDHERRQRHDHDQRAFDCGRRDPGL